MQQQAQPNDPVYQRALAEKPQPPTPVRPAAERTSERPADPAIQRIVKTWPGKVEFARAQALGLRADADFVSVVRDYSRENPDAVKLQVR